MPVTVGKLVTSGHTSTKRVLNCGKTGFLTWVRIFHICDFLGPDEKFVKTKCQIRQFVLTSFFGVANSQVFATHCKIRYFLHEIFLNGS